MASPLLDQTNSIPNQQPERIDAPRASVQEAFVLPVEFALVKQPRNEASVQCVSLCLLANRQLSTLMDSPVLQPLDLVSVSRQPCRHRFGIPTAGGLAADSNLRWRVTGSLQPGDQLSEALAVGGNAMRPRPLPTAVLHSLLDDGSNDVMAASRIDAHVKVASGGSRAAPVFS